MLPRHLTTSSYRVTGWRGRYWRTRYILSGSGGIVFILVLLAVYIQREHIERGDPVYQEGAVSLAQPTIHPFVVNHQDVPHAISLQPNQQAKMTVIIRDSMGDVVRKRSDRHVHNRGTRVWKFTPTSTGNHEVTLQGIYLGQDAPDVTLEILENDHRPETEFFNQQPYRTY